MDDFVIENGVLTEYKGKGGNVVIPDGVKKIGRLAFDNGSLKSVVIPESVAEIETLAFFSCRDLESVTFPEGLKKIGGRAFESCRSFASAVIPEGVTKIDSKTFRGCLSLESIVIPETVTEIDSGAFIECSKLKNIRIAEDNPVYRTDGRGIFKGSTLLCMPSADSKTVIPDGVKNIADEAFFLCHDLESIVITESVASIGHEAFGHCTKLKSAVIPDSVKSMGYRAFYGCDTLKSIVMPKGLKEIDEELFCGCKSLESIVIPEGVTEIGDGAFGNCISLKSIDIPEGVKEVGEYTFEGCPAEIYAPSVSISSVKDKQLKHQFVSGFITKWSAGAEINEDMKAMYKKYIKGQKKKLYDMAVGNAGLLRYMTAEQIIPKDDIEDVVAKAENADAEIKAMILEYQNKTVSPEAKEKMENEKITAEVMGILTAAQAKKEWKYEKADGGVRLTGYKGTDADIVVPDIIGGKAVTEIGEEAFSPLASMLQKAVIESREQIKSVTLSSNIKVIGREAFNCCKKLEYVFVPESVTEIGEGAFCDCESLENIVIPEGVTEIGEYAFLGCSSLVIHGKKGSCAEKYAEEYNIHFEAE